MAIMFVGKKSIPVIIIMIVLIHDMRHCSAQDELGIPSGLSFLGIGYNIIEGNPEGGELGIGGADPGLLPTRRIFAWTFEDGLTTSDRRYLLPDQVRYTSRESNADKADTATFYGTSSYAKKLSAQVKVSGSYSGTFASVEFAASTRYQRISNKVSTQGTVFYCRETKWNLGNARYMTERALIQQYGLDIGFVTAACLLPSSYDGDANKEAYMNFIDSWGTHVVVEVDLGMREGQNYEEDRSSFVTYASTNIAGSVSVSGSYGPAAGSISVDMESFEEQMDSGASFGSRFSNYSIGSRDLNEPIRISLIGMHDVFDEKFWTGMANYSSGNLCTSSFQRANVGSNVLRAMREYAEWTQVQASEDPEVSIPLTWPEGTYGLPKSVEGCPDLDFFWNEGSRQHDTEDSNSNNQWSTPLHLAGNWLKNNMRHYFCMKMVETVNTTARWYWQPGSYCIYKYGDCPEGFGSGWIKWDDEDGSDNINTYDGVVPDGEYGNANTIIWFCCRDDAVPSRAIFLPTGNNFMLLAQQQYCQQVYGMTVTKEYFIWDNADSTWLAGNYDAQDGEHAYYGKLNRDGSYISLSFCYYERS